MEGILDRVVSDLESISAQDPSSQCPLSESTLNDIITLFEDEEEADRLFSEMSIRNQSPSTLIHLISVTMDSSDFNICLLSSHVYLSVLLSPTSPLYTLFTPINFLSLLQSLRRCFKHQGSDRLPNSDPKPESSKNVRKRKARGQKATVDVSGKFSISFPLLFTVLDKMNALLHRIHLQRFPDSLKSLVDTIGELLVLGTELYENSTHFHKFCNSCFCILQSVLIPDHGDQTITAMEVLRSLFPSILKQKSQGRVLALQFVSRNVAAKAKEFPPVRKALAYFPRYLINKAPEKSEPRACAVDSIMDIVKALEYEDQIGFSEYVVKLTEGKAQLRLIAVDLIPPLLMSLSGHGSGEGGHGSSEGANSWDVKCLNALVRRCSDSSPAIRARALTSMTSIVGFVSEGGTHSTHLKEAVGIGSECWNHLLSNRCQDEKAAVRKAALFLIMKSAYLISGGLDEGMIKLIGTACSDPLVSIRKAGMCALSEIFRRFIDSKIVLEWLHAVPCLIMDNESSIQEETENLFLELVLDRVSHVSCSRIDAQVDVVSKDSKEDFSSVLESAFPKGVLTILKGLCDNEVAPCVKKICSSLGKKKLLKRGIALALQNIIRISEAWWLSYAKPIDKWTAPAGAWFLLSEVSSYLPKFVEWKFLQHYWKLLDKIEPENDVQSPLILQEAIGCSDGSSARSVVWAADRVFLLQTISNVSIELPPEPAADLAQNLLLRIETFNMHPTEVNAHVKTLRTLCKRKAAISERGDNLVAKCAEQLLTKALQIVSNYMVEVEESSKNTFQTPPPCGQKKGRLRGSKSFSQAVTAVFTIGSLVLICPSVDTKGVIPVLHAIITSGCSQPKPKELAKFSVSFKQVASSLYINTWLTMGKICLADGKLAKQYIPLFVQELEKSDCAALRNNLMVTMADFCVRYTALIDCYIPRITSSLRDPCEVVRRQTFILLSRLLQRDYVKWRGILFLRFLLSLVDESDNIRRLADFLFGNILKAKAPLLAYNSFIEAIFVLNDCRARANQSELQNSRHARRRFSIRGSDEDSRSKRMHIYVTLLKQMAPEHLLATSAKLCAEILAAASDGLLDLHDSAAHCVLQDALQVLACKEMRIQANRGFASMENGDLDVETGDYVASVATARGRVVTQEAKKNLVQNAVPIFIELKRLLEGMNSPLTGCLMECLRVLLKDYKNEIDDILVADPQLRKEILYDMQKFEEARAKSLAEEAMTNAKAQSGQVVTPGGKASSAGGRTHVQVSRAEGNRRDQEVVSDTVASAVANVAAEATARSVLKEVNRNTVASPLHAMSIPKLKSPASNDTDRDRQRNVIESVRRRQSFDSEDEV